MVAANGIYALRVIGTVFGQQHIHTLHFRSTAVSAVIAMSETAYQQGLIDLWQSSAQTAYRGCFNQGNHVVQTLSAAKVCGSVPLPAGVEESVPLATGEGSRVSGTDAMAPWLASVTTIRTGNAGRSYRGRNFLGGLYEGDVVGATLQAAILALLNTYFGALKTTFMDPSDATASYKQFVYSRLLANGDPLRDPPITPHPCQEAGADAISFLVRDQLATMKSRKAGSGL